MSFNKNSVAALVLVTLIGAPAPASAFTGVGGCSGLPEYYRALGALQGGMTSACDMSVEQAHRILSTYGVPSPDQQAAPVPRTQYRRHRLHTRQP